MNPQRYILNIALIQERMYKGIVFQREVPMGKPVSIGHVLAWPFLLPGNIACNTLGLSEHQDLVRMLVNSLIWTVLGVIAVALAV
jgi:hypothetical protein